MAYNYEYPHFDAGNYNSDWLINKMKELEETVIGLETFKYIGENEILDLNQQKQNSIAAFTSNFNVLNSPVSNVQRVTVTYGSETAYIQQLYDLSNYTVYTRNYSTASGLTAWKMTQNKPGTNLHTTPMLTSGNLNDMIPNSATIANGNSIQNAPTHNCGFVITWNADAAADKIQLWFDMISNFCYIRFANPSWNAWVELNHINLTSYLKLSTINDGIDLNNISNILNKYGYVRNASNRPISNNGFVFTYGNSSTALQMYFSPTSFKLYWRYYTGAWTLWYDGTSNYTVLHRSVVDSQDMNDIVSANYISGRISTPLSLYAYVQGVGGNRSNDDQYQIIFSNEGRLFTRFRNRSSWGELVEYQRVSAMRSLTITSTIEDHSTDDEGRDRYMMGDNIYAEAAKTMYNTYISLPGQSLLHSEEGKQSFKDAILTADLSETDIVMTNLEMWDMDIPLDTIAEEVKQLSGTIMTSNPMCSLTLLSIPPIDIPLWGDELLDYTMPNGSTIRQLDDRLFRLSEECKFTYVSFEYFYDAQVANLLEYLGDDFKTNKQYLRRVGSFIKNSI